MEKIVAGLEGIAGSVKRSPQVPAVSQAIQSVRKELASLKGKAENNALFQTLDEELGIWLKKLDVILKEPAGREGMMKHAHHWAQRLKEL